MKNANQIRNLQLEKEISDHLDSYVEPLVLKAVSENKSICEISYKNEIFAEKVGSKLQDLGYDTQIVKHSNNFHTFTLLFRW